MSDRDPYAEWVESKPTRAYHRDAFDAGVAEGIRQAREAVAKNLEDSHLSTSAYVTGVTDSVEAIDAL